MRNRSSSSPITIDVTTHEPSGRPIGTTHPHRSTIRHPNTSACVRRPAAVAEWRPAETFCRSSVGDTCSRRFVHSRTEELRFHAQLGITSTVSTTQAESKVDLSCITISTDVSRTAMRVSGDMVVVGRTGVCAQPHSAASSNSIGSVISSGPVRSGCCCWMVIHATGAGRRRSSG